jgi:hypothetical protein
MRDWNVRYAPVLYTSDICAARTSDDSERFKPSPLLRRLSVPQKHHVCEIGTAVDVRLTHTTLIPYPDAIAAARSAVP